MTNSCRQVGQLFPWIYTHSLQEMLGKGQKKEENLLSASSFSAAAAQEAHQKFRQELSELKMAYSAYARNLQAHGDSNQVHFSAPSSLSIDPLDPKEITALEKLGGSGYNQDIQTIAEQDLRADEIRGGRVMVGALVLTAAVGYVYFGGKKEL